MEIRKALLLCFFTMISLLSFGQGQTAGPESEKEKHEKIEAARIAHISSRLNLSPQQAQKFWPVYNEFHSKRERIRSQHRNVMQQVRESDLSNDDAKAAINSHLCYEKEESSLADEYYGKKFQAVLEPRQIVMLMKAEHEFKKMLLDRLKDNRPN